MADDNRGMRASKQRVIAGAAFVGALACVVLLALSSTPESSRSGRPRVAEPTNVRGFGIPLSAGLIPAAKRSPVRLHRAEGILDLRSGVEDDYPRGPVQPGERPRTLPALRLDPAWPLDRDPPEIPRHFPRIR